MKKKTDLLGPARVSFLLLTPACVLLGIATAAMDTKVELFTIILVTIGAIAAHICVNTFNEYSDFRTGLDFKTTRTPFSGGSGTLQRRPDLVNWTLLLALSTAAITGSIGIYFSLTKGWGLLPLGAFGLFIVLSYSFWLVRHPLLCLLAPGLGFGPCMVMGTYYVLTGHYSLSSAVVSLIPFFLVNNLLLLNQFPDIKADMLSGRNTLPIAFGLHKSVAVYAIFLLLTYVSIIVSVFLGLIPKFALIGVGTIIIGIPAIYGAYKNRDNTKLLVPSMALNVFINLLTPVLVSIGIMVG